jgi:hypothetical protein
VNDQAGHTGCHEIGEQRATNGLRRAPGPEDKGRYSQLDYQKNCQDLN